MKFALLTLCVFDVAPSRAEAQSAVFAGAVVRDTLSHGISGATISIPALKRTDTSDAAGEFKFSGLPSGRYAILIRRIGFKPMVDTVILVNGTSVEREYLMDVNVAQLDWPIAPPRWQRSAPESRPGSAYSRQATER